MHVSNLLRIKADAPFSIVFNVSKQTIFTYVFDTKAEDPKGEGEIGVGVTLG